MENTEKRLLKQPKLGAKYCKIIEDYINKGYLEYVDTKEGTDNAWFLFSNHSPWQTDNKI